MEVHTHKGDSGEPDSAEGKLASRFTRELAEFTISIYECRNGVLELNCSGFALRYMDKYYIVTAAHAIYVFHQKDCDIRFGFKGETRALDIVREISTNMSADSPASDLDIAAWEIRCDSRHLDELKKIALPGEYFTGLNEGQIGDVLFVCGFPLSINKHAKRVTRIGESALSGRAYSYSSAEAVSTDLGLIGKSKTKHIAIRWKDKDLKKQKITHPRGLSGSPVWRISRNGKNYIARLTGIFIEYHAQLELSICTKSQVLLILLDWVRKQEETNKKTEV